MPVILFFIVNTSNTLKRQHALSLRDKLPICKETKLTPRYKRIVHFFDQPAIRINQKHIRQGVSGKKNTNILATYFVCLQKNAYLCNAKQSGM